MRGGIPRLRVPAGRIAPLMAAAALLGLAAAPPPLGAATIAESLDALQVILPREPVAAPAFSLEGMEGRPVSLGTLRGKVVFLNFWATWCVPCREEMPAMERLYRAYRENGLAMVAVNFRESRAEVKAFMDELHLTFPAVLDRSGAAAGTFSVRGLPVTYLVDRDGKILWKALGIRRWDGAPSLHYFGRVLASAPR